LGHALAWPCTLGRILEWESGMRVLLSIRPEHVENIRRVETFEFRRRMFARRDAHRSDLLRPVGRPRRQFDIADIIEGARRRALWASTAKGSGISKDYFDAYFEGRPRGFALRSGALAHMMSRFVRRVVRQFHAAAVLYVCAARRCLCPMRQPCLL
jgi:predicted transcriptional regulator